MRNLLLSIVFISFNLSYAQTTVQDTPSGGKYTIEVDSAIDSLVNIEAKENCWKPTKKPEITDENVDVCARTPKIKGYRIQIRYTKDRNTANAVMQEFNTLFQDLSSEMVYTRPDYRVMVGEYFSKRSGATDMARIKKKYPGAFFVQWAVWCRKAK